jgi:hypothetical protein
MIPVMGISNSNNPLLTKPISLTGGLKEFLKLQHKKKPLQSTLSCIFSHNLGVAPSSCMSTWGIYCENTVMDMLTN